MINTGENCKNALNNSKLKFHYLCAATGGAPDAVGCDMGWRQSEVELHSERT